MQFITCNLILIFYNSPTKCNSILQQKQRTFLTLQIFNLQKTNFKHTLAFTGNFAEELNALMFQMRHVKELN